ncbi:gamma carbonic anhydrase family protein [uncultured Dialister sp.]|uniref:gamma carbonic anhydrase family protein n=1 Tax=uncultured Dialister sp. TaxID=278064 RepID=UPI00262FA596|nr:gamma carbonic anhydrase family protein [uncultured Dialister sp.]
MMIAGNGKSQPSIHPKAHVFEDADVIGNVTVGEFSSIWYHATVRGDKAITIGSYTNVQDNTMIHGESYECHIGNFVTIGHSAILHCCTVEDNCLIGMGACVLDTAVIGEGSIVAAGALVVKGTVVPPHSLVMGRPAKVVKQLDENTVRKIHLQALRYKTLWTEDYGLLPDADGERYDKDRIFS